MIAKLKGIVDHIGLDHLIIDVNGVGYNVFCSTRTAGLCGGQGNIVSLWIETHVREDHIHLFGFADVSEQSFFKLLTSVQGVGAKGALSLLACCPPEEIGFVIASADKATLTKADGIGPKIAARIITELKDKVSKINLTDIGSSTAQNSEINVNNGSSNVDNDAVLALVNLGYSRTDAFKAISNIKKSNEDLNNLNTGQLITLALKELSS